MEGALASSAYRSSTDAENGGGPPNPVKSFLDKAQQMITSFAHIVPGGLPPFLPGGGGPPDGPPGGPQPPYGDGGGIRPLAAVVPFSLQPLASANASADNATVTGLADSMLANLKAGNSTGVRPRVLTPVTPPHSCNAQLSAQGACANGEAQSYGCNAAPSIKCW